jgi:hypothetical protein
MGDEQEQRKRREKKRYEACVIRCNAHQSPLKSCDVYTILYLRSYARHGPQTKNQHNEKRRTFLEQTWCTQVECIYKEVVRQE